MAGDIGSLAADIEAYCLALWANTIATIASWAVSDLRTAMQELAPGPQTGTLNEAITSEGWTEGMWGYWAGTTIDDIPNPETGWSAAYYGWLWNYGHVNPFLGWTYQAPMYFMENGAAVAYYTLDGKLTALGWERGG